jgi:ketosteroid isomerase-like protein
MAAQHRTTAEIEIRRPIDGFRRAIWAKDLSGVLSVYAPDIVSFDLVPPMQYVGVAAYRRPWDETFASFEGQIGYAVSDLHITAADEVAFSHSLNRMRGTATSGEATGMWVRWTACSASWTAAGSSPMSRCRSPSTWTAAMPCWTSSPT